MPHLFKNWQWHLWYCDKLSKKDYREASVIFFCLHDYWVENHYDYHLWPWIWTCYIQKFSRNIKHAFEYHIYFEQYFPCWEIPAYRIKHPKELFSFSMLNVWIWNHIDERCNDEEKKNYFCGEGKWSIHCWTKIVLLLISQFCVL